MKDNPYTPIKTARQIEADYHAKRLEISLKNRTRRAFAKQFISYAYLER